MNSNGFHEALLGFDVRESFLDPRATWEATRRARYLLRHDAPRPLSVDVRVWPSLFDEGPVHEARRLGLDTPGLPAWTGANPGLWEDLGRLNGLMAPLAVAPHWTVALGWVDPTGSFIASDLGPYREAVTPPSLGAEWTLLGFDVADAGLISGLSNCAYGPVERESLSATWTPWLNEHHLFSHVERALAFRDLSDARVAEHAPFFVFSLYRLEPARRI